MDEIEKEYECTDCGATVAADARICPNCGAKLEESADPKSDLPTPEILTPEWAKNISQRLSNLESKIPDSGIISRNFWRRAWTVVGYVLAIQMIIALGLYFLALLFKGCRG